MRIIARRVLESEHDPIDAPGEAIEGGT